jgi:hypothetical protein
VAALLDANHHLYFMVSKRAWFYFQRIEKLVALIFEPGVGGLGRLRYLTDKLGKRS